jgi:hypothetical protein
MKSNKDALLTFSISISIALPIDYLGKIAYPDGKDMYMTIFGMVTGVCIYYSVYRILKIIKDKEQ